MNTPTKKKYDRRVVILAAKEVVDAITPACERIIVAGSLRRRKLKCTDAEICYVPTFKTEKDGLFDTKQVNQVDLIIEALIKDGILEKRKNALGSFVFGEKNKLMLHVATRVPVDLFSTTLDCWYSYLTCRTGPSTSNIKIASEAKRRGLKWLPYGRGFEKADGEIIPIKSEADAFEIVGLKYLHPWLR